MKSTLTVPMTKMLAGFAAGSGAWSLLVGRGARHTLNALVDRDLVAFVPIAKFGSADVGDYKITEAGRALAWKNLSSSVAA
jgi:hypothetical protein